MFYGRIQVPESHNTLATWMHLDKGEALKEVDWEPPLGVLDQQDLVAQHIDPSTFIPNAAQGIDALGSCTANATTAALAQFLGPEEFLACPTEFTALKLKPIANMDDTKGAEEFAIGFYHLVTWLTGLPSEEWPTTDCGSSGPYIVELLQRAGIAKGAKVASGAQNIVSLLQQGPLLQGTPFLYDWEEPDANGFVDGDGSGDTIEQQIQDGIAGGHETLITAIEKLSLTETGRVQSHETVLRVRNSWSKSWGDNGSFRIHLSTLVTLGSQCDFRLLVS